MLKKCKYCYCEFEAKEIKILDYIVLEKDYCDDCFEINEFICFISKYEENIRNKIIRSEIYNRNFIEDSIIYEGGVKSFTAVKHEEYIEVKSRTKFIEDNIKLIEKGIKCLLLDVRPQIEILDSIYIQKNIFWKESGNFHYYVRNASLAYVVVHLKEMVSSKDCEFSILKLINIFKNNNTALFRNQKIYRVIKYENGDVIKEEYPPILIEEYLDKIENLIKKYDEIISSISDYRDNQFAHIGELKHSFSEKNMTYCNLRRIYTLIFNIYKSFMYVLAPDKTYTTIVDYNMWFSHLDHIVEKFNKSKE